MNYYSEIKNKIIENEVYSKVKDYSKERNTVITYYEIGKLLNEAGKHYDEGIIKEYSAKLTDELGRGYTQSRLRYFRRFYVVFSKCPTLSDILTWSHYKELLAIKDIEKINNYINVTYRSLNSMLKYYEF